MNGSSLLRLLRLPATVRPSRPTGSANSWSSRARWKTPLNLTAYDLKALAPTQIDTVEFTRGPQRKQVDSTVRGVRLAAVLEVRSLRRLPGGLRRRARRYPDEPIIAPTHNERQSLSRVEFAS